MNSEFWNKWGCEDETEVMNLQDRLNVEYLKSIVCEQLKFNEFVAVNNTQTHSKLTLLYNYKPKNYNVFIFFGECNKEIVFTLSNNKDNFSLTFRMLKQEVQLDRLRSNSDTLLGNNIIQQTVNKYILIFIQEITRKKTKNYKRSKKISSRK